MRGGVALVAALALTGVTAAAVPQVAAAATGDVCATGGLDASGYGAGAPGVGTLPDGWAVSGAPDYGVARDGLRLSNAVAGQPSVRAARLATPAHESTAACDTFSATFTVAAVGGAYQEGLNASVAFGGTSRYGGVLGFRHTGGRLEVGTMWVPADQTSADVSSWRSAVLATLDPTVPHTVEADVFLRPGQSDDVLRVAIDGAVVAQGVFTWEHYAQVDPSQVQPHDVDTLLFRPWTSAPSANGVGYDSAVPAQPGLAGGGFWFGDVRYSSSDEEAPAVTPLTPCTAPRAVTVTAASGTLVTDLPVSPTRSLGGYEFTADGLHVWTTGTAEAPGTPTSESKSAGYVDVDVPLVQAAPAGLAATVTSGSAPGANLILADGRILVSEPLFADGTWWSATPTPGLVSGPHPSYQRAYGTLDEWAAALPSAVVDKVGYSLGSGAIGDAVVGSLALGCTVYSFAAPEPTPTPTPTTPAPTPTEPSPSPTATPAPVPAIADELGTSTASLLAALERQGVVARTPAQLGATVTDAHGAATGTVDVSRPVDVTVPWSGADDWVDVYVFSTRTFLGTFPVVGGEVRLTGLDLSALASGAHHLVLGGQSTGTLVAVALTVTGGTGGSLADTGSPSRPTGSLAATGTDAGPVGLVVLGLLVAGAALVLVRVLGRRAAVGRPGGRG